MPLASAIAGFEVKSFPLTFHYGQILVTPSSYIHLQDMATFIALAKNLFHRIFPQYNKAGLGEIFIQRKCSCIWYTELYQYIPMTGYHSVWSGKVADMLIQNCLRLCTIIDVSAKLNHAHTAIIAHYM